MLRRISLVQIADDILCSEHRKGHYPEINRYAEQSLDRLYLNRWRGSPFPANILSLSLSSSLRPRPVSNDWEEILLFSDGLAVIRF